MKKKVLFVFMMLLAGFSNVMAQESLTVNDLEVPQGGEAVLEINYKLEGTGPYVGFLFLFELPEGITAVEDADNPGFPWYDNNVEAISKLSVTTTADGFAATPKGQTSTINGDEGVLIRMKIKADESLQIGETLQGKIKDAYFNVRDDNFNVTKRMVSDVSFNITIGEDIIKFDENASTLPAYTAGEKGNVSMKRTIKAGEWSTIVLPFTITKAKAETAFGTDVELAEFAGFEVDYGEDEDNVTPLGITINLSTYTMTAKKGMTGGKPFLIKTSKTIESFEAEEVTLVDVVTDASKTDEYDTSGKLTGTLVKTKIPADGLFISDGDFWYSTGKTEVKAFRCWFELGAVLDKDTDFGARINLVFNNSDGTTTGVGSIDNGETASDSYYDLQGRKIEKPVRKGLYIRGGKKVVK